MDGLAKAASLAKALQLSCMDERSRKDVLPYVNEGTRATIAAMLEVGGALKLLIEVS